jgi:hypothetical protein
VQLLLDTHRTRQSLPQALTARDATGQTPLHVAMQKNQNATIERPSVARWDAAAGHVADWEKCIQLLQLAQNECPSLDFDTINHDGDNTVLTKTLPGKHHERSMPIQTKQPPEFPEIPLPLSSSRSSSGAACLVCPTTEDGKCLTLSWESQFWAALAQSTNQQLFDQTTLAATTTDPITNDDLEKNINSTIVSILVSGEGGEEDSKNSIEVMDKSQNSKTSNKEDVINHEITSNESDKDNNVATASPFTATLPLSSPLGRLCDSCHTQTFALYPSCGSSSSGTGGLLVCKKCQRKGRRRTG